MFELVGVRRKTAAEMSTGTNASAPRGVSAGDEADAVSGGGDEDDVMVPCMFSSGERVRIVWHLLHGLSTGKQLARLLQCEASAPLLPSLKAAGVLHSWFALHNAAEKRVCDAVACVMGVWPVPRRTVPADRRVVCGDACCARLCVCWGQVLETGWVRSMRQQPIDTIKDYLGESTGVA